MPTLIRWWEASESTRSGKVAAESIEVIGTPRKVEMKELSAQCVKY